MDEVIGFGSPVFATEPVDGTARWFREPQDVISSIDSDLESTIAVVEFGGTTFLGPVLGRLAGIVCMKGSLHSHLGIVSREFEIPCLMALDADGEIETGDKLRMVFDQESFPGDRLPEDKGALLRVAG
jgi:signal transduction protein with GAF and PtsI domain